MVKGHAGHHLHVEGPHADHAVGHLSRERKRLRQQIVQAYSLSGSGTEARSVLPQLRIRYVSQAFSEATDLPRNLLVGRKVEFDWPSSSPPLKPFIPRHRAYPRSKAHLVSITGGRKDY